MRMLSVRGPSIRVWCATMAALSLVACGAPAAAPPVVAPRPEPTPVPVVVPVVVRASLPATVPERRYDVRSSTRVERDSAGRKDEQRVETSATIALTLQRAMDGALRGSGRVDSFAVRLDGAGVSVPSSSSKTPKTPPVRPPAVLFDALLDATNLRVVTRPPLPNECDRPEVGATSLVRELMIRLPREIVVGDRWRDSTISFVCRAGIPIAVRSQHEYAATRIDGLAGQQTVVVTRLTTSLLEGRLQTSWRALELTGTGFGNDEARVDVTTGALVQLEGTATLSLRLTDRTRPATPRTEQVVQRVTLRVSQRR